jgi:hypothetical protein
LSNVGFDPAKELEGIDVGRLGSNQEPAANRVRKRLAQNIRRLGFGGTEFAPKRGFDQRNAGELGHRPNYSDFLRLSWMTVI